MLGTLAWKEYREHRGIWLVMAAVSCLLLLAVAQLLLPGVLAGSTRHEVLLVVAGVCLTWAYGMLCGAMLLASEAEEETLSFLDMLPCCRRALWQTKSAVGTAFVAANVLAVGGALVALGVAPGIWAVIRTLVILLLAGWIGLGWGLLFSARGSSVLQAIGLAVGSQVLSGCLLLMAMTLFDLIIGLDFDADSPAIVLAFLFTTLLATVLTFVSSRRTFSRIDRLRVRPTGALSRRLSRMAGLGQLCWLSWRQARGFTLALALASVGLGWLVFLLGPSLWPLLTLVVGVLCGATTFADEQCSGAYRFLGEQRIPPARTWLIKTLVRFAAGLLALFCLLLPGTLRCLAAKAHLSSDHLGRGDVLATLFGDDLIATLATPMPFLLLWFLHGFTIGQLCGLLIRKPLVAVIVALGISVVCASIWLPSVASGGLLLVQVLGIPLAALVAGRLVFPAWTAARLTFRRTASVLSGCAVVGLGWVAAGVAYRVAEVPPPPLDVDIPALTARIAEAAKGDVGLRIRLALTALGGRLQQLPAMPPPRPRQQVDPSNPADASFLDQLRVVVWHGWPQDRPQLRDWLDQVFDASWGSDLEQAVAMPLGVVEDARNLTVRGPMPVVGIAREASLLLLGRGLARQAKGDDAAFLKDLRTTLALARQVRHHAISLHITLARSIERTALNAVDRWLERLQGHPHLLRRLLAELRRHEATMPEDDGNGLAVEYLMFRNTLDHPEELSPAFEFRPENANRHLLPAILLAWRVPWERERHLRLLGWTFVASGPRPAALRHWPLQIGFGLTRDVTAGGLTRSQQSRDAVLRMRLIGAALRLYQLDHPRPAPNLESLLDGYLPELPKDPYDGHTIRYRISEGEDVRLTSDRLRPVLPGQAILWCAGETLRGDGGNIFRPGSKGISVRDDEIYIVPLPPRR
jgi:hypothetical protein